MTEITFFFFCCPPVQPAQQSQTLNQRTGCSSTTRTSASRVWLSEAPSPRTWRRERPDEAPGRDAVGNQTQTFTDTGSGPPTASGGARWCWRRRRQPLSINLTLITSYLGLPSRRRRRCCRRDNRHTLGKRRQERSYRITSSRLYRIHVLSLAIALRPAHSLTRTLNVTCACSATSVEDFWIPAERRIEEAGENHFSFTIISPRHVDAFLTSPFNAA